MTVTNKDTKALTGQVRLTFPHLFEPHAFQEGQEAKYSVRILIPKTDKLTLNRLKKAFEAAKELGISKGLIKRGEAKNFTLNVHDGDEKNAQHVEDGEEDKVREEYKGHYFMNVSAKTKPGIVKPIGKNPNGTTKFEAIEDTTEIYSGCYAKVSLNFYAYNVGVNKGVTAGLNNVAKTMDGEYLGGRSSAADDFANEDFDIDNDFDDDDDFM